MDQGISLPCDPNCKTCFGPVSSNCLSCYPDLVLNQVNDTCQKKCPSGFFKDQNSLCQPCDLSCRECTGSKSNNCLSCTDLNTILDKDSICQSCLIGAQSSDRCQFITTLKLNRASKNENDIYSSAILELQFEN